MLKNRFALLPRIALVGCLLGCSSGVQPPLCYPVHGKVSFKGKPLGESVVVFHRVGGDVEGNQKPMAITKADGTFELTTYSTGDGAPPGEYAITVERRALTTGGEEAVRNGPNTLPPKYASPQSTDIKFTIIEGENEIPPIALK
jgi:hypothetical protein